MYIMCFFTAGRSQKYKEAGQLLAYALAHSGQPLAFFSDCLYTQVCGKAQTYTLNDVTDAEIQHKIRRVGELYKILPLTFTYELHNILIKQTCKWKNSINMYSYTPEKFATIKYS